MYAAENQNSYYGHCSLVGVSLTMHSTPPKPKKGRQQSNASTFCDSTTLDQFVSALDIDADYEAAPAFGSFAFDPSMCLRVQEEYADVLVQWCCNPVLDVVSQQRMVTDKTRAKSGERLLQRCKRWDQPQWIVATYV